MDNNEITYASPIPKAPLVTFENSANNINVITPVINAPITVDELLSATDTIVIKINNTNKVLSIYLVL